ncbi:glycosyltransferase family protein [Desulfobacula toluolica]|nr:glycosyltransferase [Desulfobacula toluolica]
MLTRQNFDNKLPEKQVIWSWADNDDFKTVIDLLMESGVPENDIGEMLFRYADQAIAENKLSTAIAILIFLAEALEDKSEAPPLLKKVGQLYALTSKYDKAREYYGKLPLTLENIKLCFETFIPLLDINGLLSLRDSIILRVNETSQKNIHSIINKILLNIYTFPDIFTSHADLFKKNIEHIKTNPPFSQNSKQYESFISFDSSQIPQPNIIKISDNFYTKKDGVWLKIPPSAYMTNETKKLIQNNLSIMVHCDSFESFFIFIDKIKTNEPQPIKFGCWVIVDFEVLRQMMHIIDFSPLNNCDFVIRFIDKNNLRSQLTHILLERKLPFIDRAIYISQDDPIFFSKHVLPILKDHRADIVYNIESYEQQLCKIFPDNYHDTVIQKIKTGQKLNILFFTSRFTTYLQYSTRDIAKGFRQLGHNTFIEIEDEDSSVSIRKDVCLENLINFKPDVIFSINNLRQSYPWIPKSIPFITWMQDLMPHIAGLKNPSIITDHDYIFSFSQDWIDNYFKNHTAFKNKKIHCLPVTVDTNIYHPISSCKKKYKVTSITHLVNPGLTFLPIIEGNTISEIKSEAEVFFLKQLVYELDHSSLAKVQQISSNSVDRKKIAEKVCQKIGIPINDTLLKLTNPRNDKNEFSRFTYHCLSLMKIKPILALITNNIDVRVFGRNWEKYPQFKNIAMGIADNGKALNKIINESCINLNSAATSFHMKVPEVMAAEGFLLTRRIPRCYDAMPITDFFDENKEIIFYEDEFDLVKKVNFFLKNKKIRNKLAKAAHNKFITCYGVDKAAQSILKIMKNKK